MNWRPLRLFLPGAVLFVVGWALVFASGHGNNPTGGGSELVWRIGGVMVYVSVPVLLAAMVWGLAATWTCAMRRRAGNT